MKEQEGVEGKRERAGINVEGNLKVQKKGERERKRDFRKYPG